VGFPGGLLISFSGGACFVARVFFIVLFFWGGLSTSFGGILGGIFGSCGFADEGCP